MGRTALLAAGAGPGQQLLEHGMALGQVGLQHDAGLDVAELILGQHGREHVDGQCEVPVLLHVQVHEGARRGGPGCPVEPAQALGHALDGARVVVRAPLCGDRGDLRRDVGDLGAGEHLDDAIETVGGLILAEDGLAQDVDVRAGPPRRRASRGACAAGPAARVATGRGVTDRPVRPLHRRFQARVDHRLTASRPTWSRRPRARRFDSAAAERSVAAAARPESEIRITWSR